MKKLLSVLLLVAMLLSVFVACGGNDSGVTTATTVGGSDSTEPQDTTIEETDPPATTVNDSHDLPSDLRFDGQEFVIGTYVDGNISQGWANYFDVDEPESGNLVEEAAYSRNLEVEQLLGITITGTEDWAWSQGMTTALEVCSLSGVSSYDMMALESIFSYETLIIDELIMDIATMPYMDLSKPYYNQQANSTYYLRDNLYFFVSDITFPCQSAVQWLVNDEMLIDLGHEPDYLYELVESGDWTIAVVEELIEGTYKDLNSNGEKDLTDVYGMGGTTGAFCPLYPGAGLKGTFYTEDGFDFDYGTDFSFEVYDKILALKTSADVFCIDWIGDPWMSGNALFTTSGQELRILQSMTFDFSVLPIPRFNDEQDRYYNFASGGVSMIPANIEDDSFSGAVIEAMASASAKHLVPAFHDNFIEQGVLCNTESWNNWQRMLDDWAIYEFCYLISPDNRIRYYAPVYELLYSNDEGFSSSWDAMKESIAETCWIFFEFYLADLGNS